MCFVFPLKQCFKCLYLSVRSGVASWLMLWWCSVSFLKVSWANRLKDLKSYHLRLFTVLSCVFIYSSTGHWSEYLNIWWYRIIIYLYNHNSQDMIYWIHFYIINKNTVDMNTAGFYIKQRLTSKKQNYIQNHSTLTLKNLFGNPV